MSQTGAIKKLSVYQYNSNNETFCIYKPFTKLLDGLNGRPYIGGFVSEKRNCNRVWPWAKVVLFFVKYFSSAAFSNRGFSTNASLLPSQGQRVRWVRFADYLLSAAEWEWAQLLFMEVTSQAGLLLLALLGSQSELAWHMLCWEDTRQ